MKLKPQLTVLAIASGTLSFSVNAGTIILSEPGGQSVTCTYNTATISPDQGGLLEMNTSDLSCFGGTPTQNPNPTPTPTPGPTPTPTPTPTPAPLVPDGVIIVGPAVNERTILPDCVNGIAFTSFAPSCFLNSDGVSFGEIYAVAYDFKQGIGAFEGEFFMDETGGGGYDIALSTTPGDMNPPMEGCKSLFGGFGQLRYVDTLMAAGLQNVRVIGGRIGITRDPLAGLCVVDPSQPYYLNVRVVDQRCNADDPFTSKCSAIILQNKANLDL